MLLIIGSEFEKSITYTCKWLNQLGIAYRRISLAEMLNGALCFDITGGRFTLDMHDTVIRSENISAVWIRKAGIDTVGYLRQMEDSGFNPPDVMKFLGEELKTLLQHFFTFLESAYPRLGSFFSSRVNKLNLLQQAQSLGIRVPRTIIATRHDDIPWETGAFITKPMSEIFSTRKDGYYYSSYTATIKAADAGTDIFFPSLVQQKVNRRYDIRAFIIGGQCFSVAIAQQYEGTTDDWRDAAKEQTVCMPYHIPPALHGKLLQLMDELQLKYAAIDLMEDEEGNIFFLEINPDGAYTVIEETLHIDFEYMIAQELKKLIA